MDEKEKQQFMTNKLIVCFYPNRKKEGTSFVSGTRMNKNAIARHSGSADWVKEELKKFTQITDPKQVEKIRLYMGPGRLTKSFKSFFVPTGVDAPEEIWASQTSPRCEWAELFHIKIGERKDWQLFDCPVCGHEIMLRTRHNLASEIGPISPSGECEYCKAKFPNQTVRKPQLGRRNAEYNATTTII